MGCGTRRVGVVGHLGRRRVDHQHGNHRQRRDDDPQDAVAGKEPELVFFGGFGGFAGALPGIGAAHAAAAGVEHLLLPGIDSESDGALFDLCRSHPGQCVPMMGLHPTSVNDNPHWREELALAERYLTAPPEGIARFCAVGEIGLDYYWSGEFVAEQVEAFVSQCRLAARLGLPVAIHTRAAWDDMCRIIGEEATAAAEAGRRLRGVFHAFSEDAVTYRKLKACGDFAFGIGGVVTFRKSKLADTVREMELDDIVLETDCPYLTPAPHRGERNESAYVRFVCEKVAELKGLPPGEVAAATTANAKRIFGI